MFIITYNVYDYKSQNPVSKVETFEDRDETEALKRYDTLLKDEKRTRCVIIAKQWAPKVVSAKKVEAEFRKDLTELVKAYCGDDKATPRTVFSPDMVSAILVKLPPLHNVAGQLVRNGTTFAL